MNLAFPLFLALIYLALIGISLYLGFAFVFAIVRMSRAIESASRSLEVIATKYSTIEPKSPQ